MKLGRVLIYLGILLALGAYIYFIEIKQKGERQAQEEKAKKIVQLEKGKILAIRLESPKGPITLKKPADLWVVGEPVKTAADKAALEVMLDTLADATPEKVVLEKDVKWEDYGLDKPEFTVTVSTADKNAVVFFGASNPAKTSYYVRVEGDPRLFLVQDTLKNALNKSVMDLRDKTVVGLAVDDVDRLVVTKDGTEMELRKTEPEKWLMVKPEQFTVKKSLVRTVMRTLTGLNAKDIIDEPIKEGDPYGLDQPEEIYALSGKDRDRTLLLGKTVSTEGAEQPSPERYARVKGRDVVYRIDGRSLKGLKLDPEALRDRTVLDFNPMDVEKVEVELDGKQWVAIQGKDNKWNLEKPEKKEKLEAWAVTAVLWDIRDLEWKTMTKPAPTDLASAWLDKPRFRAGIYLKGKSEPYTLTMGWKPDPPKPEPKPEPQPQVGTDPQGTKPAAEGQQPQQEKPEGQTAGAAETVNALAHPTDEQGALFMLDAASLTRLKADLERLGGNK